MLLLANGDSVVVTDDTTEGPGAARYWLDSFKEPSGYFVVGMWGYENRGSVVVNSRSGWRKDLPFNFPLFSANGQFAALIIPTGAAFWDPTIDIYVTSQDSLVNELHLEGMSKPGPFVHGDTLWGPTSPFWVGNELHLATEENLLRDMMKSWPGDSVSVIRIEGAWKLVRGR